MTFKFHSSKSWSNRDFGPIYLLPNRATILYTASIISYPWGAEGDFGKVPKYRHL